MGTITHISMVFNGKLFYSGYWFIFFQTCSFISTFLENYLLPKVLNN